MPQSHDSTFPARYELRLQETLDAQHHDWLQDVELRHDGKTTIIRLAVQDQAALHGLLRRIRDTGLTLLAMFRLDEDTL